MTNAPNLIKNLFIFGNPYIEQTYSPPRIIKTNNLRQYQIKRSRGLWSMNWLLNYIVFFQQSWTLIKLRLGELVSIALYRFAQKNEHTSEFIGIDEIKIYHISDRRHQILLRSIVRDFLLLLLVVPRSCIFSNKNYKIKKKLSRVHGMSTCCSICIKFI